MIIYFASPHVADNGEAVPGGNSTMSFGSGGTIFWDDKSTNGGLDINGIISRPSYIGLGHELVHASDSNQGLLYLPKDYFNAQTKESYIASFNGLLKSEWRAVYRENIIRGQAGIPLRSYYGYDITTGTPHPIAPKLLNIDNTPLNY